VVWTTVKCFTGDVNEARHNETEAQAKTKWFEIQTKTEALFLRPRPESVWITQQMLIREVNFLCITYFCHTAGIHQLHSSCSSHVIMQYRQRYAKVSVSSMHASLAAQCFVIDWSCVYVFVG